MYALSIRQPWASLIVAGIKDVENRTWRMAYRGPLLIHASQRDAVLAPEMRRALLGRLNVARLDDLPHGGIIGRARVVDCVDSSPSPWFLGPWGILLADARPLRFKPCTGRLFLFQIGGGRVKAE